MLGALSILRPPTWGEAAKHQQFQVYQKVFNLQSIMSLQAKTTATKMVSPNLSNGNPVSGLIAVRGSTNHVMVALHYLDQKEFEVATKSSLNTVINPIWSAEQAGKNKMIMSGSASPPPQKENNKQHI